MKYPNPEKPTRTQEPMRPNLDRARQAAHALALAPSRDEILHKWGLEYPDVKDAQIGIADQSLTIPFFRNGTLEGVKCRRLSAGPEDGGRYFWMNPGKAPTLYIPPGGLGDDPIFLCEGPLKAIGFQVVLGRPVAALPNGCKVGVPAEGREHFRGRSVLYVGDADEEGRKAIGLLRHQLNGVAGSLRAIAWPREWDDINQILNWLHFSHDGRGDCRVAFPGIAARILRELEHAPDLLNGKPQPARRDFVVPGIDAGDLHLPSVGEKAWAALHARNDPPEIFRRAGFMACLERDDEGVLMIRAISQDRLRHLLGHFASWYTERKTGKVPALPPFHVVRDMLARPNPPLPILARIVHAPVFDHTGVVATSPGYHPTARIYYAPAKGFTVPPIPTRPTRADLAGARTFLLDELLGDFPFVGDPEIAHTVALLLLPYARELIDGPTPLHLFEKPTPGTGATLLADVATLGVTEGRFSTMTEGRDEDEWRKRITSKLMGGAAVIVIDNLRARLQSAALSKGLTDRVWEDRMLGTLEQVNIPVRCVWVATGNNPALSGEMVRRSVRIRLDAKVDRPWLREQFRHPALRRWAMQHRSRIVWAALVLVQAWVAEGRPDGKGSLGMFETWATVIGGILDVAGIPGFLGNLPEFYDDADTEGVAWRAFISAWWDRFEGREVGVSDLWTLANPQDGDPFDLGLADGKKDTDRSAKIRLGKRLGEIRDRQFEGYRIVKAGTHRRAQLWKLVCVNV